MNTEPLGPWASGLWTLASMLVIAALAPLMDGMTQMLGINEWHSNERMNTTYNITQNRKCAKMISARSTRP